MRWRSATQDVHDGLVLPAGDGVGEVEVARRGVEGGDDGCFHEEPPDA
jgi:hypothetical protein